jgi:predicted KAP-like P-loop ATPase
MKFYSASLGLTKSVMQGLPALAQLALAVSVMTGVSPLLFTGLSKHSELLGSIAFIGILITAFVNRTQIILEAATKRKEAQAELNKKTLQEIKAELSETLEQLDQTFLVIIDDIDRLTSTEISEIFQLVKANADFPNFVYLLPFQRSAAVALKDVHYESGGSFLEKIIQVPFDIPVPDRSAIEQVLDEKLERIFASELRDGRFDRERFATMFQNGLRDYFPDLRAVNRFTASLAFHSELLRSGGLLEVNAADLITLEVLRIFEPSLYHRISGSKGLLTGDTSTDSKDRQAVGESVLALLEEVDESKRSRASNVLRELFPNRGWAFKGMTYGSDHSEDWHRGLQICSGDFFDRYFCLVVDKGSISQSELAQAIASAEDADRFERMLREILAEGRIMALFDMLEPRLDAISKAHIANVVVALCSIGEELPDPEPGFLSIPATMTASRLVRRLLFRVNPSEERARVLKQAIHAAKGISVLVILTASESARQKKPTGEEALVTSEQLEMLTHECLQRIRSAARDGSLVTQKELAHILFRWNEWGGPEEVRAWASQVIKDDHALGRLLEAFTSTRTSTKGRTVVFDRFIKLSNLDVFFDVEALEVDVKRLSVPADDIELKDAVDAFFAALKRRRAGELDSDFGP